MKAISKHQNIVGKWVMDIEVRESIEARKLASKGDDSSAIMK